MLDPWEQDGGTATTPCPCPWQPLSRKQVANRSRSSINMKNFRKFNARRKWKVKGVLVPGWGGTPSSGVPREPRLRSIPGLAVAQGFMWGGHSAAVGRGGEKGATPPRTPALLPPQLSYNMVSACNRLCRTRLLCGLRKEDEELVSGQEPPRSPASAWAGAEDIWGGPAAQMEVAGGGLCNVVCPHLGCPLPWGGWVSSFLGASSLLGGFLSPGGVPFPGGVLSLPSSPPVPPAPLRE